MPGSAVAFWRSSGAGPGRVLTLPGERGSGPELHTPPTKKPTATRTDRPPGQCGSWRMHPRPWVHRRRPVWFGVTGSKSNRRNNLRKGRTLEEAVGIARLVQVTPVGQGGQAWCSNKLPGVSGFPWSYHKPPETPGSPCSLTPCFLGVFVGCNSPQEPSRETHNPWVAGSNPAGPNDLRRRSGAELPAWFHE